MTPRECIKSKVNEELAAKGKGCDRDCSYYPCHFDGQDCTFCYCPFYPCNDTDLGCMKVGRNGEVWSCTDCLLIHRTEVCTYISSECSRLGITDADDDRLRDLFDDVKGRFHRKGKALMVVGATSDAGKSITVAALCRILHRRGYLVAPFKSQNMSLNAKVTPAGEEIALAQMLQARAACITRPDTHMNPILLKPKGDTVSQVIVNGRPFGDYDVERYYGEFVPEHGRRIVRENIEFLKGRYDLVIMEGAGSPAEINIYDVDIANMCAAVEADANVILVVNVRWGGSFAYAIGTIELIPEPDRSRIKGVVFNDIRGDMGRFLEGANEFERMSGIPVIGCIPHADVVLPSEDSETLRGVRTKGDGGSVIGVIRYPRIANFTDIDPLFLEDASVVFVERPEDLDGVDAVILPGTKNTVNDLTWMMSTGIAERVKSLRGKVPIVGICGGYQMMGTVLKDPLGLEGGEPTVYEGLGFFDMTTTFGDYSKRVVNNEGTMLIGDKGRITGYELHMGVSESREKPLFEIRNGLDRDGVHEGSVRETEMLFGTYQHGIFDRKPFRGHLLSLIQHDDVQDRTVDTEDYDDIVDRNLDLLADVFERNLVMDAIMDMLGVGP